MPDEAEFKQWDQKVQWGTFEEIRFLKGLGSWRGAGLHRPRGAGKERRTELLKQYKLSMKARVNWGDINPKRVMEFVDRELAKAK